MKFQLTKLRGLGVGTGATHCLSAWPADKLVRTLDDHFEPARAYLVLPGDDIAEAKQRLSDELSRA